MCKILVFLNFYFISCWEGVDSCMIIITSATVGRVYFTNKTAFLPGFVPRAMFQIDSSGEHRLFKEKILAQFFSAMPAGWHWRVMLI